ncbi:DUF3459 domain-containing protein [Siccirubricoccus sp. G192]|uniref:DUF3459 domain-containing protein n=1 Tax=Siccirubricoccus sp. G192 TaxID=2849651 RepID=UPI0020C481CD|nr:DUF3459 domain-containing protein [Siccirubricoccus sp. G192]
MLRFTRTLLRLRRAEPALRHGEAVPLALAAPLFGFTRQAGGRVVTLLFNLSAEPVPLPAALTAGLAPLGSDTKLPPRVLAPWGFALLAPVTVRVPEPEPALA